MSEEATVEDQLMSTDPPPPTDNESVNDEKDESEEEYEIEAILDARRGMFGQKSRMGYFVKWKGYDETENSWVDENDASGAAELIREFWATRPKHDASSSKGPKSRGRARKSEGANSARSIPSKRVLIVDTDSEAETTSGKRTKSAGLNGEGVYDVELAQNLSELANKKSWERDVSEIETCEKDPNGILTVYFKLSNGVRCKEEHRIARQRFPQKLLDFYEHCIAWRDEEGHLISRNGQK